MLCPICTTQPLVMSERSGIEIDYCPVCRGVWLDRGELDKLIERSMATVPVAATQQPQPAMPAPSAMPATSYRKRDDDDDDDDDWKRFGKSKRKKGLLGEIFDF